MANEDRVSVVALIKARRGMEEQLRKETEALVKPTRSEAGCLNYDLHHQYMTYDLHQYIEDPSLLIFYENWRSEQDLREHLEKPYIKEWFEKTENLREGDPDIKWCRMVSTPNLGTAGILTLLLRPLVKAFPLRPLQRIFAR